MTKLIAFHGSQAVKDKYIERIRTQQLSKEHVKALDLSADQFCAALGFPSWLPALNCSISQNLVGVEKQKFQLDFVNAIPVGADISEVRRFLSILRQQRNVSMFEDNNQGDAKRFKAAIGKVIAWHQNNEPVCEVKDLLLLSHSVTESLYSESRKGIPARLPMADAIESAKRSVLEATGIYHEILSSSNCAVWAVCSINTSKRIDNWFANYPTETQENSTAALESFTTLAKHFTKEHFDWETNAVLELLSQAPIHKEAENASI